MQGKNNKFNNPFFSPSTVAKNILPYYNLPNCKIKMIKYKNTDKERVVYKVISEDTSYCLKKIYYSKDELLFIYSVLEWLYKRNINVPKLIPTINNGRFVQYNKMIFILTPWINGIKCDFDNVEHVLTSSIELAKMHKRSKNFVPPKKSVIRKALRDYYILTLKHFEDLLQISGFASTQTDIFSKKFLSCFNYNLELAEISLNLSSTIKNSDLSVSLCHGDFVNKNIIFTPDNNLYMIDFDKCCIDYIAHDISYFLRRLLKRENTKWNIDLGLAFLKRYNYVNPLSTSDLKYIISYLAFPQKYYKTSKDYYKKKLNKNDAIKLLSKLNRNSIIQLEFINTLIETLNKANWNLNLIK